MVWCVVKSVMPTTLSKCEVYKYKRVMCGKKKISDRYAGVWCGNKFTLVVLRNGDIGVCEDGELVVKLKIKNITIDSNAYCNKNRCRLSRDIVVVGGVVEIENAKNYQIQMQVCGKQYESNLSSGKIVIGGVEWCVTGGVSDIVLVGDKLVIGFSGDKVRLNISEQMKSTTRKKANAVLREYFGVFDINNVVEDIPILNNKTRKRIEYIDKLCNMDNWVIKIDEEKIEGYKSLVIDKFGKLQCDSKIKLNITQLGISRISSVKVINKKILCIKDLDSNYSVYLEFCGVIENCCKCVSWGEDFVLINLNKNSECIFIPFYRGFDVIKLGVLSKIDCDNELSILNITPQVLNFEIIMDYINRVLILGYSVDIVRILRVLKINNLGEQQKFVLCNMVLSYVQLTHDKSILGINNILNEILEQCKNLNKYTKGMAKRYIQKLLNIVTDERKSIILELLEKLNGVYDKSNWESVFCDMMGLSIVGGKLYCNSDEMYNVRLKLGNKIIKINKENRGYIQCNDTQLIGLSYINLDTESKEIMLKM